MCIINILHNLHNVFILLSEEWIFINEWIWIISVHYEFHNAQNTDIVLYFKKYLNFIEHHNAK